MRSYIKHEEKCFIRYPDTSKLVKKNSAAPRFFNPLLSVWISDETLFLVFDILRTVLPMLTVAIICGIGTQHGMFVIDGPEYLSNLTITKIGNKG